MMVSSFNGFFLLMLLCNVEDAGGGAWGKGGKGIVMVRFHVSSLGCVM